MDFPVSQLPGVGPGRVKILRAAGIDTVRHLLSRLPVGYRDMTAPTPVGALRPGAEAAVLAEVCAPVREHRSGSLLITKTRVADPSGAIWAVWYNQPWMRQNLSQGRELLLYGRVEARSGGLQLSSPSLERERLILPVYKTPTGIAQKTYRELVAAALRLCEGQWPDELPESLRMRLGLCERNFAMQNAHRPVAMDALAAALRRMAFEELLLYQVGLWLMRGSAREGVQIECSERGADRFWEALPFPPTGAQRWVLREIALDLAARAPMARLVQGDVGCGKTAVAFGALKLAVDAGWQGALMAPTEVLAIQHYQSAKALFEPMGIAVGLLTGSMGAKAHREAHAAIREGRWRIAIGTHALITQSVAFERLGLVITDEQHRFGVKQRTALGRKGDAPNVLVMSATPIPRTLSLILYGDLDVSIVDELPPGRTPVKTRIVPEEKRAGMYGFLRAQVRAGHQVYVVCPLVEESEAVDAQPAEQVYERLRTRDLSDLRVGLVHGRMKAEERDRVLAAFHAGDLDVLVSTTVIEVGVNVPNATAMVVENAERFGLAQLHQLRGRVGRGAAESWCFLLSDASERLRLLVETGDGFVIAQKDMEIRGPGELFGLRQSGTAGALPGSAEGDMRLLKESHDEARALLRDPDSAEAEAVIGLAKAVFQRRIDQVAMN